MKDKRNNFSYRLAAFLNCSFTCLIVPIISSSLVDIMSELTSCMPKIPAICKKKMYIRLLDNSSMHRKNTHCTPTNTMPRTWYTKQHYFYISNPKIHTVSLVNWIWKFLNSSGIWDCVPGKQMVQSYF